MSSVFYAVEAEKLGRRLSKGMLALLEEAKAEAEEAIRQAEAAVAGRGSEEALQLLSEAKADFSAGRYKAAAEKAKLALEAAGGGGELYPEEALLNASSEVRRVEELVSSASSSGLDVTRARRALDEAHEALKGAQGNISAGLYEPAAALIEEALAKAKEAELALNLSRAAYAAIAEAEGCISDVAGREEVYDVSDARAKLYEAQSLVSEAKLAYHRGEYEEAVSLASSAKAAAEEAARIAGEAEMHPPANLSIPTAEPRAESWLTASSLLLSLAAAGGASLLTYVAVRGRGEQAEAAARELPEAEEYVVEAEPIYPERITELDEERAREGLKAVVEALKLVAEKLDLGDAERQALRLEEKLEEVSIDLNSVRVVLKWVSDPRLRSTYLAQLAQLEGEYERGVRSLRLVKKRVEVIESLKKLVKESLEALEA
ncbi:MAG: hypothetical protein DRN99_09705 [Thermoproteota archaeon]|nr:MAG: hypothetical protein DRN99_09705 [Candidatus Korarchaeota archaeon]